MTSQELFTHATTFLRSNRLGVLSTISRSTSQPQSAVVYYLFDAGSIYFVSDYKSKKITNIRSSTQVALCIFDEPHLITMQIEGQAQEVQEENIKIEIPKKILKVIKSIEHQTATYELPPVVLLSAEGSMTVVRIFPFTFTYSYFSENRILSATGSSNDLT